MVSEWRSVIAVSLKVGGGVRLIKLAKLYMCMQTHYKQDEDGCTAPGVRGHGCVPLSHLGNVLTRTGLHTHVCTRRLFTRLRAYGVSDIRTYVVCSYKLFAQLP